MPWLIQAYQLMLRNLARLNSHLVERQWTLLLVDLRGGIESARVLLRRLKPDFDNVYGTFVKLWVVKKGDSDDIPNGWPVNESVEALQSRTQGNGVLPINTCATPPTAPANRSFRVRARPPSSTVPFMAISTLPSMAIAGEK